MLDALGHFLYLRFGDDAIAQFWGKWRNSELDKFRSRRVRFWQCHQCPPRHGSGGGGREVEYPEVACYGKVLQVDVPIQHAPPGTALPAGATTFTVTCNEEDVRRPGEHSFVQGTRWTVGGIVELRVASPASGALGPWVAGRVAKFGKCGGKMGATLPWSSRPVDCFVLLLTRDGSHGLDLSMLTNLYLADQVWDPAVEQQVVARAFRMGATGPCHVEQLLMKGTLEQTLHHMVNGSSASGGKESGSSESGSSESGGSESSKGAAEVTDDDMAGVGSDGGSSGSGGSGYGCGGSGDSCVECQVDGSRTALTAVETACGSSHLAAQPSSPPKTPVAARVSNAQGKKRVGDGDGVTPPGKRVRWGDGGSAGRVEDETNKQGAGSVRPSEKKKKESMASEPPHEPTGAAGSSSSSSAAAQEQAKVHSLLRNVCLLRG